MVPLKTEMVGLELGVYNWSNSLPVDWTGRPGDERDYALPTIRTSHRYVELECFVTGYANIRGIFEMCTAAVFQG